MLLWGALTVLAIFCLAVVYGFYWLTTKYSDSSQPVEIKFDDKGKAVYSFHVVSSNLEVIDGDLVGVIKTSDQRDLKIEVKRNQKHMLYNEITNGKKVLECTIDTNFYIEKCSK